MIRVVIAGAGGQTGSACLSRAKSDPDLEPIAVISRVTMMDGPEGLASVKALCDAGDAEVVIDFTVPGAAVALATEAAALGMPFVTGTTGLSDEDQAAIADAATRIPIVQSGNFSLGVNLLTALVQDVAARLPEFDIEITEAHHRRKLDSPSGTALMLGAAAARGAGTTLTEAATFGRHGQVGPRKAGEIGFSVIRGGGVVGDHEVSFLGDSEQISIRHQAIDRGLFAQGAVVAAKWAVGKSPGLYSMRDVLGL